MTSTYSNYTHYLPISMKKTATKTLSINNKQGDFSPPSPIRAVSKLALNWLCFFAARNRKNPHIPLSCRYIRSFQPPANWVCFFKLSSIFRRFLLFFTCFFHYFVFFPFENWLCLGLFFAAQNRPISSKSP